MTGIPDPLTPPECDLRGFDWMALLGDRLFKSTFYRRARKDPRGGLAGIKLWWEAMLQKPAGSLPNDEEELCMLADFGEDLKAWRKHRDVAMHGWTLCSDGRLYHHVVAEQAIDAWDKRRRAREAREGDAERLRRWRRDRRISDKDWERLRAEVFARDGGKCVRCGSTEDLHCDHILELANGGTNDIDNLMTLCRSHHSAKTAKARSNWNDNNDEPPPGGNGGETHFRPPDSGGDTHFGEHFDRHSGTHSEVHSETHSVRRKTIDRTETGLDVEKGREGLVNNSNVLPMSRARSDDQEIAAARASFAAYQARKRAENCAGSDEKPADKLAVLNQVGKLTRALGTTADHAQGKRPERSVDQQIAQLKRPTSDLPGVPYEIIPPQKARDPQRSPAEQMAEILGISVQEAEERIGTVTVQGCVA